MLTDKFRYTQIEAGFIIGAPYLITAILTPILAKFTEKYGRRMTITLLGQSLLVVAHLFAVVQGPCNKCPTSLVPFVLIGLSFAAYAVVLYGMIPFMVEARLI